MNNPLKINCPGCQKSTLFDNSNPYRPFCSERCRLIDLGKWANDEYAIPLVEPLEISDEDEPID